MKRFTIFLIVSLSILSCSIENEQTFKSDNFHLVKLTEGVFACIHKIGGKAICNVGIIDNGNETIIFDTFLSPSTAKEIFDIVEKFNLSPIKYVVNSHYHNDHIRGNQLFSKDIKIISTRKTKELIEKWEPEQIEFENKYAPSRLAYYDSLSAVYEGDSTDSAYIDIQMWKPYYEILSRSSQDVVTTLPNLLIDTLMDVSGSKRKVKLISKGKGHTESDLILYLPDDNIVFAGDILFNDCHPYIGDGFPNNWISYLDFINELKPIKIVPGHGRISDANDLTEMKDYLITINDIADQMIREGKTEDEIPNISIPGKYKHWQFERFFGYNLNFLMNLKKGEN